MTDRLRSTGAAAFALVITGGLVAVLGAAPASARDLTVPAPLQGEALSTTVTTAGLDLSVSQDQRRLQARIRSASRAVCAPMSIGKLTHAEQNCREVALASAAPQVARLAEQAQRLAAAGLPSRVVSTVAVSAGAE